VNSARPFRKARLAKRLTLKQVADAMQRAESHPSRWEYGKLIPSAEDLGALALSTVRQRNHGRTVAALA
jgi:transcriptional regulator with XRE-family HTH domain